MRKIILALCLLLLPALPAMAQNTDTYFGTPGGGGVNGSVGMCLNAASKAVPCSDPSALASPTSGAYFTDVVGSTITRPNDTTAYVANETVCLAKTVTACVPGTIAIASANAGKQMITRVTLLKSGSSVTTATFVLWFFSAAPGLATPTQFDSTAYTGPRAADMPNYLGNANCASPVVTSDTTTQVWYECTLSNPNTSGALVAQALAGSKNIDYLLSVTSAYTPVANETFTPYVSGMY